METKIITAEWNPGKLLLETQLTGNISIEDIEVWEKSLNNSLDRIETNGHFKIFINLYDFTAIDFNAHKRFRTIIPMTLAEYGWKVGYINLFEKESEDLVLTRKRGINCIAAAHCHHDATKIDRYEKEFSRHNERFFTDSIMAINWLEQQEGFRKNIIL